MYLYLMEIVVLDNINFKINEKNYSWITWPLNGAGKSYDI